MQLNRCPVCHSRIGLEALVQDEAGRELLGLLVKMDTDTGSALVGYLSLFRSGTRDLANNKALKLATEALALAPWSMVAQAMRQTADSLQGKSGKPLSNHNYLKKVLEDVTAAVGADSSALVRRDSRATGFVPTKTSKTAQALQSLEDFGHAR